MDNIKFILLDFQYRLNYELFFIYETADNDNYL